MRYVVSYDLNRPGQNYPELWDALRRHAGQKVLLSQWAISSTSDAGTLRDYFWKFMDSNDRLLVVALDGNGWAGMNLMVKLSNF